MPAVIAVVSVDILASNASVVVANGPAATNVKTAPEPLVLLVVVAILVCVPAVIEVVSVDILLNNASVVVDKGPSTITVRIAPEPV